MDTNNLLTGITPEPVKYPTPQPKPKLIPRPMYVPRSADKVEIGQDREAAIEQAGNIVMERAMAQLRSVVDKARADLGIPEGAQIDTSAEATATRIADFALGAFDAYRRNHSELGDDEARKQFVDFIGAAITKGVDEARDILTALNAMTPEVVEKVDTIASLVQQRLDDFASNT